MFCTLSLFIIFIIYPILTPKTIPDSIVIPKSINSKNIPLRSISGSQLEEEEPILKVAQEIKLTERDFTIIDLYKVVPTLYIDEQDSEYDDISLIAETLQSDLALLIGGKVDEEGKAKESSDGLKIITDKSKLSGKVIIAGTYGENGNEVINQLIEKGTIDIDDLEKRWKAI